VGLIRLRDERIEGRYEVGRDREKECINIFYCLGFGWINYIITKRKHS